MRPKPAESVVLLDPSQIYRPEEEYSEYNEFIISRTDKTVKDFRNYDVNLQTDKVHLTYRMMHENQTMDFVKEKKESWCCLDKFKMTIMEAVHMLDALVDESDPDTDLPNSVHAFQTAERIRVAHPDKDWFHLIGLLHDLGKVMALWGEPQYCVVGDTFPLGCKFSENIVFPETFTNNPDTKVAEYSSKYGIYEPNCGLDNITMSWGHDEYMYQVLTGNNCKLPKEGLYMIRYHSFYPWHCNGDYNYLCNEEDREMLKWVKEFNKFDLYSKSDAVPDVEAVTPYYEELIAKYCPGQLSW
ncbi:inositol oxygenase-like [Stylophora pistillata]|uniref:Inositol oxygenase n=1 Tax=Stylophora pistillata TaxID=50429 RepID=A0A2B4SGP2_STYPI|nr:inositol oxygenase-like [Stylophora pistillata]PFX28526.1 Inositol oxygenase [Stylophora pistillata]